MNLKYRILLMLVFATMMLQSCGGLDDNDFIDADEQARLDDAEIAEYLKSNGITAERDEATGIYTRTDVSGSSTEEGSGRICGVYYTVSLLNSDEPFEKYTEEDGESLLLKQGASAVIPWGLDLGLADMSVGDTHTLYIPSQYAYGQFSFPDILPANSVIKLTVTLDRVFSETELLDLETDIIDDFIEDNNLNDLDENPLNEVETLSSGVRFKLLARGQGEDQPIRNQLVAVRYVGSFLDGKIFDQTQEGDLFRYRFDTQAVISGFDEGVGEMRAGDRGLVIIPSNSAYAQSVRVIPSFLKTSLITNRIIPGYVDAIDPYSILTFEIEINDIQ